MGKPKQIDNPDYKGKWVHPEIDNPDYTPDDKLYLYKDIGAVGVDVWQVKSGTIFDNFFIGDDFEEAKKFAEETWGVSKDFHPGDHWTSCGLRTKPELLTTFLLSFFRVKCRFLLSRLPKIYF